MARKEVVLGGEPTAFVIVVEAANVFGRFTVNNNGCNNKSAGRQDTGEQFAFNEVPDNTVRIVDETAVCRRRRRTILGYNHVFAPALNRQLHRPLRTVCVTRVARLVPLIVCLEGYFGARAGT